MKKERNSNIELLRIVSMILVILSHYSKFGNFKFDNMLSANALIIKYLHSGGKIGVTIFIFISGYFLSQSKKFNLSKQIKLILEVLFYDIFIIAISVLIGTFSAKDGVKQLFSILFNLHPFVNGYLIMVFLSPFINIMINNLKLKEHINLALLLLVILYLFPTFLPIPKIDIEAIYYIAIYIFASLYKKTEKQMTSLVNNWSKIGILSIFLILVSETVLIYLGVKLQIQFLLNNCEHFRNLYSILVLISSVSLFISFKQKRIKQNKVINSLATSCFAIFLVHNGRLIRYYIWDKIFKTYTYQNSKLLIFNVLISVIIIYLAVYIIDIIRQKLEQGIMKKLSPKIDNIQEKYNKVLDRIEIKLSK